MERALEYEAGRQWDVWNETHQKIGDVPKQTRGWDDAAGITRGQRQKEESSDYRYFPDPDLVPVTVTPEEIKRLSPTGEMPAQLKERLETEYGISAYDAGVLVHQGRAVAEYYLDVADRCDDGKLACNWVTQTIFKELNEREISIDEYPVRPPAP